MKLAILGDTHFGMRNDSEVFHDLYEKFYKETFFPILKDKNVNKIIQLGDLFDRRKYINFNSLYRARNYFFDRLVTGNFELYTFLGNHDIFFKNTLEVNSPELLLEGYWDNINVIRHPGCYKFDGLHIDLIPWIVDDNKNEIFEFIKNSNSKIERLKLFKF